MANLALNLVEAKEMYPDRVAVRLDELALTYSELDERSARVAGLLAARGVAPGDRVGLMLPNVPEFPVLYYGVLRAGGGGGPDEPAARRRARSSTTWPTRGARLVFAWHGGRRRGRQGRRGGRRRLRPGRTRRARPAAGRRAPPMPAVAARADDDTAVILYTSGTTGRPKGAELTHANLARNAAVTATTLLASSPDDVVMGCLPLFHSFGQTCGLNAAVGAGACLTLMPRFDPGKALEVIERDRVTVFEGVPTMYVALLNHPGRGDADVRSLRAVRVRRRRAAGRGAARLRGGLRLHHPGGLRAVGDLAGGLVQPSRPRPQARLDRHPHRGRRDAAGRLDGGDVAAGEVGEIAIRGHNVMKGYWGREEATGEAIPDGWFRTGDLARQDDRRLLLHRRPQEGPDHPRRLQRLPA